MSSRLEFAIDAARAAGQVALRHFQTSLKVERKADSSPVTIADVEAENSLRAAIHAAYPSDGILGEESGASGQSDCRWVLDPIDGTKSFVSGVPLFGTLLAYEEAGVPQLGVCYFPALDELVYAERGAGCHWNGSPCRVSRRRQLAESVVSVGGLQSLASSGRLSGVVELGQQCLATRTWCDAYGHALVATGRIEAMIDPKVSHWDIAAMAVIVEEAGGTWTDIDGNPGLAPSAISSNGLIHSRIVEAVGR